jgi:hypothetical protein
MRQIDEKHHITDDGKLMKNNGQEIPLDEPTILFRGRDKLALPMLHYYYNLCSLDNATQYQLETMKKMIQKFQKFADESPTMKQPGSTLGK